MIGEPWVHGSPILVSTAHLPRWAPTSLPFDRLRMYGSMVLYFLLWVVFLPYGQKNNPRAV